MSPSDLLELLRRAVDAHDIDAVVSCFAPDYCNESPTHPGRSFEGHAQVRTNWTRIFAGLPDIEATVTRAVVEDDVVWSEWELRGHRVDGVQQVLRGVIIFGATDAGFGWARFYLEPVDDGEGGVDEAVRSIVEAEQ